MTEACNFLIISHLSPTYLFLYTSTAAADFTQPLASFSSHGTLYDFYSLNTSCLWLPRAKMFKSVGDAKVVGKSPEEAAFCLGSGSAEAEPEVWRSGSCENDSGGRSSPKKGSEMMGGIRQEGREVMWGMIQSNTGFI
jgi:hypothetical protein